MKLMKFEFYFYFRTRSIKVYNSRELFNLLQTSASCWSKIKFYRFSILNFLSQYFFVRIRLIISFVWINDLQLFIQKYYLMILFSIPPDWSPSRKYQLFETKSFSNPQSV